MNHGIDTPYVGTMFDIPLSVPDGFMPTEQPGIGFWKRYPTQATYAVTVIILVLCFSLTIVVMASRMEAMQENLRNIKTQFEVSKGIQDERDKTSIYRDTQLLNKLEENAHRDIAIETSLDRIWKGLVISGVSDDVPGGKK